MDKTQHIQSISFRATLAHKIQGLRRVRSRTPFFRLAAHRVPTLWGLYRGLLRAAPTENIKFRVRALFRQNKGLSAVAKTKEKLQIGYKWLEFFRKAQGGDAHSQKVLARYSRMIGEKRAKADMMRVFKGELENQLRMRTRPIYTGGFLRPTLYYGPLPRMKPQPEHISMLIKSRIKSRERRLKLKIQLTEDMQDIVAERKFEEGLMKATGDAFDGLFAGDEAFQEWTEPIKEALAEIQQAEERSWNRSKMPFPPEMVEAIFEARREKIRNKTRERERERRGELTRSALRRQRKGPPAHILARMTPEQRRLDKVSRTVVEVGYPALVKRRLGFKMKDTDAGLELGQKENRALLDKARDTIRAEHERRMRDCGLGI